MTHSARNPPGIPRQRPSERKSPRSRRQVDFAPRPHPGGACGRRNPDFRPAGGRRRPQHRQIHARAGRQSRADRAVRLDGRRRGRGGLRRTGRSARFRQFRHRLPAGDGGGRGLPDHRGVRWRRLAALPPDAADPRSAGIDGRQNRRGQGRRPPAADAAWRARSLADRLPHAGRLRPDQVGGAAGGARRARRHHGHRAGSEPRPHRADAEAFWRRHRLDRTKAAMAARFR